MEFFPPNVFNRDWETVVRSMGIRYVAWQGDKLRIIRPSLSSGTWPLTGFPFVQTENTLEICQRSH
jgi:hypothetical protein